MYTTPLPTSSDLASLYDQQFYGVAPSQQRTFWEPLRHALHLFVLEQRRRALLGRPPGTVLDVGCGDGDFLAFLQRRGWKGVGTEYSPDACVLARRKGVRVIQGELREAALPPDSLDVVTLWHVLEHLPQPLEVLQEVHRLLRGDGLLVVEVPCITSPTFRLCGESWFPLDVPRHLQHFSQQTLTRLLARAGFTPVRWQHYHRAQVARDFLARRPTARRQLEQLSSYAAQGPPNEGVWHYLKHVLLRNLRCRDPLVRRRELSLAVKRLRHRHHIPHGCTMTMET
ncbi:MAG: class I SAM-dependent methyltransferase [Chloroflexi bacterium]|nr:class I SAM-dependent methyltransferase [Chloroflexota bacterium]